MKVLFRAVRDTILALTSGNPEPISRYTRQRRFRPKKPFRPGFQVALHTFGGRLNWNVHFHVLITAGGLSANAKRWNQAPKRSLLPALALATEWKVRVMRYIQAEHKRQPLFCRRLKSDGRRREDIRKMMRYIASSKWQVRIGQELQDPTQTLQYIGRYTRRPVIGETRLVKYDGRNVSFRYKDYYAQGRTKVWTMPVLQFIDRLVQHIPDAGARPFRAYGLLATRTKTKDLALARKALRQRKRPRPAPLTWAQRRQASGEPNPMGCPACGGEMYFYAAVFGRHRLLAKLADCLPRERIRTPLYLFPDRSIRRAVNQ